MRNCLKLKKIYLIFWCCSFNILFAQHDLKLEIINDTIKKVSSYDDCNILYSITNTSETDYYLILDSAVFNEDPEYKIEPLFMGLPDYYIYKKNDLIEPGFSFGGSSINIFNDEYFRCEEKIQNNDWDPKVLCRFSKLIVHFKPKEEKVFSAKVNFPNYKGRTYNLKNKEIYYFEMSISNPLEYVEAYLNLIPKNKKKYMIFTGKLYSNKVPLIYEVYN